MADYPEWVLEHKKKGTYINRVGDKYYLYVAHSERIKGTKKVRKHLTRSLKSQHIRICK